MCLFISLCCFWCVTFGPQPECLWWGLQLIWANAFGRGLNRRADSRHPRDVSWGLLWLHLPLFCSWVHTRVGITVTGILVDVKEMYILWCHVLRQSYTLCWLRASWPRCSWQMFNDVWIISIICRRQRQTELGRDVFTNTFRKLDSSEKAGNTPVWEFSKCLAAFDFLGPNYSSSLFSHDSFCSCFQRTKR